MIYYANNSIHISVKRWSIKLILRRSSAHSCMPGFPVQYQKYVLSTADYDLYYYFGIVFMLLNALPETTLLDNQACDSHYMKLVHYMCVARMALKQSVALLSFNQGSCVLRF